MNNWILDGHEPIVEPDLHKWAEWFETADHHVAKTTIRPGIMVSTVFLGVDHNFLGMGPPILFETMVFGGDFDQEQERYATWDEAEAGHKAMVERVGSNHG